MKFDPTVEELLQPGIHFFTVINAEDCVSGEHSKNPGTPMIKLLLKIENSLLSVWLVSTVSWKIVEFLNAVGLQERIKQGDVATQELIQKSGKCAIAMEYTEKYGEQPKVVKFLPKENNIPAQPKTTLPELNDDIPF